MKEPIPKSDADQKTQSKTSLQIVKNKVKKLQRTPVKFVKDSKAFEEAHKTVNFTWTKLGSYVLVLFASALMVIYYSLIASDRYTSETQFVVEQSGDAGIPVTGLAAFTGVASPALKDALILKKYIESREMAFALDNAVSLKAHYQREDWDWISRLSQHASAEAYLKYYQKHIKVTHDDASDVLHVEVQTFDPDYSNSVADVIIQLSENFINALGNKIANEQVQHAEKDVIRTYQSLQSTQSQLIKFQDEFELFSPEQQSSSLLAAISELEGDIVKRDAELKSLLAFMREDAPEVQAKKIRIDALRAQLEEEKKKLTSGEQSSINKIAVNYQEIKLKAELASNFYSASLSGLEAVRADAFKKLKHLLIIERPAIAEDGTYPRRLYSIVTWFVLLTLFYFMARLVITIINEHKE